MQAESVPNHHKIRYRTMENIKKTIMLLMVVLLSGGAWAQPMTEQEAVERALEFMNQQGSSPRAKVMGTVPGNKVLMSAKVEAKNIYAFNVDGGGYIIVSGDRRTLPVLGYSSNGSIDWDEMPDNMKAWMREYEKALTALDVANGKNNTMLRTERKEKADHEVVEPLLKTTWSQSEPYNLNCPLYEGEIGEYNGVRAVTGCVATAMAQILNYHRWPEEATAVIPEYDYMDSFDQEVTHHLDALPATTFDWDKMLPSYIEYDPETGKRVGTLGTQEQQEAVAKLMRYCGQSAKMDYSPDGSGSLAFMLSLALPRQYGYDRGCRWLPHSYFSFQEWEDTIYNELKHQRPVFYSGDSNEGGHAFVCDGYAGNHYFHINWGWEGRFDGNFLLDILDYDPEDENSGFTGNQSILIGVQKPTGESTDEATYSLSLQGKITLVSYFEVCTFNMVYYSESLPSTYCQLALGTIDDEGNINPLFLMDEPAELYDGFETEGVVYIDPDEIPLGTKLQLFPCYLMTETEGAQWTRIGSERDYIFVEMTEEGDFDMYRAKFDGTISVALAPGHTARVGENTILRLTVTNNGEELWEDMQFNPFYITCDAIASPWIFRISGKEGETSIIDVPFTPTDYGEMQLGYSYQNSKLEMAKGSVMVDKGQGVYAMTGTRIMNYVTPTGEQKTVNCQFGYDKTTGKMSIGDWTRRSSNAFMADIDMEGGVISIPTHDHSFMDYNTMERIKGKLTSDTNDAPNAAPLQIQVNPDGTFTMEQPWYLVYPDAPTFNLQGNNTTFRCVNATVGCNIITEDGTSRFMVLPSAFNQEDDTLCFYYFRNSDRLVKIKLNADGTFVFPRQCTSINASSNGSQYLGGCDEQGQLTDAKGHYDTTHLYFDQDVYMETTKIDESTGEHVKTLNQFCDMVVNFLDDSITVPDVSTAISTTEADAFDDDSAFYDLQGRCLNGRPMQPGVYIHQGQKVLVTP